MSEQLTKSDERAQTDGRPGAEGKRAAKTTRQAAATTPHGAAWGALTRTHSAVTQRLQEALAQADFPPLPWYEVLATVADAPDQRMRMGDLAEILVITRGGLTKLMDRLVKAGLMERTFCDTDRRVSYATLLPAGAGLLAEMRPDRYLGARARLLGQPHRPAGGRALQDSGTGPRLSLRRATRRRLVERRLSPTRR